MKDFKVAEARARFGELLDQAEQGDPVCIERRGIRFTLQAERPRPRPATRRPFFTYVDPDVMRGEWTWVWGKGGVQFRARRKRR